MTVFGILFMWLIAVAGCIVMKKKSGHQMVPGLCFWSVCSRHYRDCWNLRNLTAIDVKSSLLLTPAPEKIAFKYYAATFQQYAI